MAKKPRKSDLSPMWRELEQAVAGFESGLRGSDYDVTSPDLLRDNVTGESREVDVSIKNRATGEYAAIAECRDRNAAQNVTWVEQALSKAHDLGVPLLILVSSRGFSKSAKTKASHYGVRTRMVTTIDPEEVRAWFRPDAIVEVRERTLILEGYELEGNVEAPLAPASQRAVQEQGLNAQILLRTGDLPPLSVWQFFGEFLPTMRAALPQMLTNAPETGRVELPPFRIPLGEDNVFVETEAGRKPVRYLVLRVAVDRTTELVPITSTTGYSDSETGALAQAVDIGVPVGADAIQLRLQRNRETGETKGTVGVPASLGVTPEIHLVKRPPPN